MSFSLTLLKPILVAFTALVSFLLAPVDPIDISERCSRIKFLSCCLTILAAVLVLRIYSLQGEQHLRWLGIAARQHKSKIEVEGARGTIFDTYGRPLAVSVQALAVGAHPKLIANAGELAKGLSKVLGKDVKKLEEKLKANKSFVWLARGISRDKKEQIAALGSEGIVALDEFRRYFPQGKLAGPVLGRVGREGNGLSGIELQYNRTLSAPSLNLAVKRDARGRFVTASAWTGATQWELLDGLKLSLPADFASGLVGDEPAVTDTFFRKEGGDVVLSIDSVLQDIVEDEFAFGLEQAKAKRVFGLLMDADSGEILALAQNPSFDPNRFENVAPQDMRSFVIQDSFEPGSTLKPVVAAVALEHNLAKVSEIMNCESGRYQVGPHIIRDAHPVGVVTFSEMLVRSSNICMTKIGQRLGAKKLYEALREFGFGELTGIELPGEAGGILRNVSDWKPIDIATHSFGQGVSVTALQMVQAYSILANGGYYVRPTLAKREGETLEPGKRLLSAETIGEIQEILQQVTEGEHGTGKKGRINGIAVHAKTGTAQKARKDGRGYDPEHVLGSFIGFVNGQEIGVPRKLVMFVAVDEPGVSPRWGGTVAGPIFKRAMERVLSHVMTKEQGGVRTALLKRPNVGTL